MVGNWSRNLDQNQNFGTLLISMKQNKVPKLLLLFKVVHHRCQAIAVMFNVGNCSSFTFYPIDTKICMVCSAIKE